MLSLNPKHLKRYRDLAWLLYKYGRSDLVQQAGLAESFPAQEGAAGSDAGADPEKCALQLARDLESLGPAYVKLGQLLSTRPDFLPQPYLDALARLQDHTDPVPWDQVLEVMKSELAADPKHIFTHLDPHPLAAASLGQVHRATLRDGRHVVVKVQRPGIRKPLLEDLDAFDELSKFMDEHTEFGHQYQLRRLVRNLRESILRELNYAQEARNATTLADNLRRFHRIVVPRPIEDFSTTRVLTMEYIAGSKITDLSPTVLIELDREPLADELFNAYLHQVLVDGVFHADPHPGNLALTRDRRIVLMDFGLVVRVAPQMRAHLIRLLLAVCNGDGDDAAAIGEETGEKQKQFNSAEFHRRIRKIVAENVHNSAEETTAGRAIMNIQKAAGETGLFLPDEMVMLGKTLMHLDRVVITLSPKFDPNAAIQRHASNIMQSHSRQRVSAAALYQSLLETTEFAQEFPARANKLFKTLANNEFEVHVDAIDETKILRGVHKIANRITAGLVVAALIVGASLMMQLDTKDKIMGYPALALIFFVVSAIAGARLYWKATFSDQKDM